MLTPYELLIKKYFDYRNVYYSALKTVGCIIMNADMYATYELLHAHMILNTQQPYVYTNIVIFNIYNTLKQSLNYLPEE